MADYEVKGKITTEADTGGVDKATQSLGGFGGALGRIGEIAAGVGLERIAEKFVEIGKKAGEFAVKTGTDFEQWKIAFDTMLGDQGKSSKLLSDISEMAVKTPFELPQLIDGSKRLLAYNIDAQQIIPTLNSLGSIASGVGTDKLPQLILAFGQVKAATHLTGAELRQFSEAGVPLLETLAKKAGKSMGEMQEMISDKAVTFEMVQDALGSMTEKGGKFFDIMKNQSGTFGGIMSNIHDQFSRVTLSIIGFDMAANSPTFGQLKEGSIFAKLKDAAQGFLTFLDTNKEGFINFFNNVITTVSNVVTFLTNLYNFVAPIIAGIVVSFVDGFNLISTHVMDFINKNRDGIDNFFTTVKIIVQFAMGFLQGFFGSTFKSIIAIFADAWEIIKGIFKVAFGVIEVITSVFVGVFTGNWDKAWKGIQQGFKTIWDGMGDIVKGWINLIMDYVKGLVNGVLGIFNGMITGVNKASGGKLNISTLPTFASGVTNFTGGMATVGENGPETVYLPKGSSVVPNSQGGGKGGFNVNQTNYIYSDLDMEQKLRDLAFAFTAA